MKERRRTKAKEWRFSDAVGGCVTWKAAFRSQRSEAGVGLSDESRVGVNRKGSSEDQSSMSSSGSPQKKGKAVIWKESAETQGYVSCQDTEVETDKGSEEMGFVPTVGWHELLRVKCMCGQKVQRRGLQVL